MTYIVRPQMNQTFRVNLIEDEILGTRIFNYHKSFSLVSHYVNLLFIKIQIEGHLLSSPDLT